VRPFVLTFFISLFTFLNISETSPESCEIISDWLGDNSLKESGDISIVSFFSSKSPPTISDKASEKRIDLDPDAFFSAYPAVDSNELTCVLKMNQGYEVLLFCLY